MRSAVLSFFVLAAMAWGNAASADVVTATASGDDPTLNPFFWSIDYVSGDPGAYIKSVTIDLSPLGAYFDFDGSGNYSNATGPVITANNGIGLPITPVFAGSNPSVLTFNFVNGFFDPGEGFKFAADFDGGGIPDTGDYVAGAYFSVVFEDNSVRSGTFGYVGRYTSRATIPEPGMLAMAGFGLFGVALRRRRRRKAA